MFVRRAGAGADTLRITQWTHFVPAYDEWFGRFTKEWGERRGARVLVDHVAPSELRARAAAEVAAQRGSDLFGFLQSPASHEAHVLPVSDVVGECERRFGKLVPVAQQGTYNPRARRHFALADGWAPDPVHYRTDWWGEVGVKPDTWERIREGARKIRETRGIPAGFGLAPELDSNAVLRGLLWAYGASEQDEAGGVTINSKATVEAVKLMTAIFKESMTADVFSWDPSSNNRLFVYGKGSIIQNAISAIRSAEKQNPEVARRTALAPPPAGPKARLGSCHVLHCYVIWKFAENPEAARTFLVDLVAGYPDAFAASEFYNFPCFPKAVPNVRGKLAADRQNPQAYQVLADAERWSAAPGYPGYTTAAIDEAFEASVIPNMFARAARGEQTAEASVRQAEGEMRRIFAKWKR